jgi:DNA-binding GntR family transcriptional regulator
MRVAVSATQRQPFRTKTEIAVELLREAILGGEIEANAPLRQADLAKKWGISLTPLREAMRQVAAEGLIVHEAHKGMHVAEFSAARMREIDMIRAELESLAARHATPRLDAATLEQLVTLHDRLCLAEQEGRRNDLVPLNYEFHMTIYRAAGLEILLQEIVRLWAMTPRDSLLTVPERPRMSVEEHEQILRALEARDAELAARRVKEHIQNACQSIVAYIESGAHPRGGGSSQGSA